MNKSLAQLPTVPQHSIGTSIPHFGIELGDFESHEVTEIEELFQCELEITEPILDRVEPVKPIEKSMYKRSLGFLFRRSEPLD